MQYKSILAITLAIAGIWGAEGQAAPPAYLRAGGIQGDSRDLEHKNWFEIIAFDQAPFRWTKKDGSQNLLPNEPGLTGPGTLTVTRFVPHINTGLYEACVNGSTLSSVTLDIPVGEDNYMKWTLSDVMIKSVVIEKTSDMRITPLEQITFNFKSSSWK